MKKYIHPSIEIVNVQPQEMIAESLRGNNPNEKVGTGNVLSNGRRRNGWDVDW